MKGPPKGFQKGGVWGVQTPILTFGVWKTRVFQVCYTFFFFGGWLLLHITFERGREKNMMISSTCFGDVFFVSLGSEMLAGMTEHWLK